MKYVLVFIILSVASVSAQQSSFAQTKGFVKTCAGSNMPVIVPLENIDPKIIKEPIGNFDSKIEIPILCLNDNLENTAGYFTFAQPEKKQMITSVPLLRESLNRKIEKP